MTNERTKEVEHLGLSLWRSDVVALRSAHRGVLTESARLGHSVSLLPVARLPLLHSLLALATASLVAAVNVLVAVVTGRRQGHIRIVVRIRDPPRTRT